MVFWTAEAKFKLLLAIVQSKNVGTPDWEEVVKLLGSSVTMEACKQQFKAIKKITGQQLTLNAPKDGATPPVTPRKRKFQTATASGDDDEGSNSSPKKAFKKASVGVFKEQGHSKSKDLEVKKEEDLELGTETV